jgi:Metallo-beta-lactamase superfamily
MEATYKPHGKPVALKGNVYVSTYGQTKVHSYLSPPDGLMVNTQIVEGRSSVVIFDGQLHLPYAEEVASYIKTIGKPVDRFILSHGHSDHWSGLQVLTERFPAAEVYAIAGVAELIRLRGSKTLERAKRLYGDRAATRVTVPSRILEEGVQEIDGVVYDFKKFEDGESEVQLTALLPRHKLLMAFDLVFPPTVHAFTVAPFFDHWIGILGSLKAMEGYETIMVGHYWPVDRSAIDSTIAYLSRAKEVHSTSPDARTYSERIKAAFPERQQQGWVDYSTDFLYGPARPR